MQAGYFPIVVSVDDRALYINLLSGEDAAGLTELFAASMRFEAERMAMFH